MKTLASGKSFKNPAYWLFVATLLNFALVVYLFISLWQSHHNEVERRQLDFEVESIKNQIIYYDEVLTMSARMASLTGDPVWEKRYNDHVTLLDKSLTIAKQLFPTSYRNKLTEITAQANEELVAIETRAFTEVNANRLEKAQALLFGKKYKQEKNIYSKGITRFAISQDKTLRLKQLLDQIRYIDEVLTMSARMAALTGDPEWEQRYSIQATILDAAIAEALILSSNPESKETLAMTDKANQQLISMEEKAFTLVHQDKSEKAAKILLGENYLLQKDIYSEGIKKFSSILQSEIEESKLAEERSDYLKILIIALITILLFTVTAILARRVRLWESLLEKNNKELEKKTDELQVFSYSISHDLKAPLKTIQGFSERIDKSVKKSDFGRIELFNEQILSSALRLDKLVDDVLSIIKSDHVSEEAEELNLEEILTSIEANLVHVNAEKQIEIKTHLLHQQPLIASRHSITQILENLISNSIKYADTEKDNSYLKVQTNNLPDELFEIRVSDNGVGIPENQQHKIFNMFFRAHSEVSFGSGLGLHLVKKKIEKMHGTIEFYSSEEGTEFIIKIPRNTNKNH